MYLKGIILSLALLCVIAEETSKPQCAFSIPALLKSGEKAKVCLEIMYHKEPVNVNMVIEVNGLNYTVANEEFPVGKTFNCPEFLVPEILSVAPVFLKISALGASFTYTESRSVIVAPMEYVTFIQLGRSIYKPSQTARANVISLTNNLIPVNDTFPLIYVTNPSGIRVCQWKNQMTVNGILSIAFEIPDEPEIGLYYIYVERGTRSTVSKPVEVQEFVMPNFQVELSAPNGITIQDTSMPYSVTGTYVFGSAVPGKVSGKVCRAPLNFYPGNACNRNPDGLCVLITGELDTSGTFSGTLDLAKFQMDRSGYAMGITMHMTVIEQGSEIQVSESKYTSITTQRARVYFNREHMQQYYRQGIPCSVMATVEDGLGKPMSDQILELQVNGVVMRNLTTDENGRVQDFIDTTDMEEPQINIQMNFKNIEQCYDSTYLVPTVTNDYYSFQRFYSQSLSYVQLDGHKNELPCGQTYNLTAKYILGKSGLPKGVTSVNFNYMVMSKLTIQSSGTVPVDLTSSLQGEFTITLTPTAEHAPVMAVVVYCLLPKEVVAHTVEFNTEKCFKHQVSLTFSEKRATPGSTVDLNIASSPSSMCVVRIIDSSLNFLTQDRSLTAEEVYSSLHYNYLYGYYAEGYNVVPPPDPCITSNKRIRMDSGLYCLPMNSEYEGDTSQEISRVGLFIITNASMNQPRLCEQPYFGRPNMWATNFAVDDFSATARGPVADSFASSGSASAPAEVKTMRTFFPEALLFALLTTSASGSLTHQLVMPGTITEWKGNLVCLNSQDGFGMTKYPTNITTFQDFFVSQYPPYSMVRTETMNLKVTVSNYMQKCAKVKAKVDPSDDYTAEATEGEEQPCICSGQRASFTFTFKPQKIGMMPISVTGETTEIGDTCDGPADPSEPKRIDTVMQSLIVELEGIPQEATDSRLICVKDEDEVIEVNILPPENSVQDATTARISVIGDVLGSALSNSESLIKKPAGCGEQNAAVFMPLILITELLQQTDRLTPEKKDKALQYIQIGYMTQLSYRRYDGSFSTFRNGPPSSWLTLVSLNAIHACSKFIEIDQTVINQALTYLAKLQDKTTGAFIPEGTLFNNALKGGADGAISFTAGVADFLLGSSSPSAETLLRPALNFLIANAEKELGIYNKARMFLTLTKARYFDLSSKILDQLKEVEIKEAGTTHWARPNIPSQPTPYMFSQTAASAEIEITSIILQGCALRPSPDVDYMSGIAQWIALQQTGHGSFSSTADTVEALKGMTVYSAFMYRKDATNSVEVKNGDEVVRLFNLDPDNRNLLQIQPLTNIPGNYKITVSGNGCVVVQTTVGFSVPVKEDGSAFQMSAYTPPKSCVNGVALSFPVYMNISYNSFRKESNMALLDVTLPSGYIVEPQSLMELRSQVAKVELKNNHMHIYFDSVTTDTISIKWVLQMTTRVLNLQPKYAQIWDYYETGENGLVAIHHPCFGQ